MPRKKKEEIPSSSQLADESISVKPVKKVSKTISDTQKDPIKKPSARTNSKKTKTTGQGKKQSDIAESDKGPIIDSPAVSLRMAGQFKRLPRHGETQLVAFIRDPQCVFTYWEVTPQRIEEVKRELHDEFANSYMVLRVYNVGPDGEWILSDEIRVEPGQVNHYVELRKTGGTYVLEIGQKTGSGRYVTYAQSNPVLTSPQTIEFGGKNPASAEEISEDMLNYFCEQGYDPDFLPMTKFISSGENQIHAEHLKRLKRKKDYYKASFF